MNIKVLERIIDHPISGFVSVVMALRAAGTALSNPVCENLFAARNLGGNRRIRKLRQRVWQAPGFILRPQDLQIGHPVVADFFSIAV